MNTVDLYANCKFFRSQKYRTMACKLEELHYSSFSHVLIMTWNIYQGEKKCAQFSPYPGKCFCLLSFHEIETRKKSLQCGHVKQFRLLFIGLFINSKLC